jgi:L-seryl-tRNA(Ser) seleniumtransferase
VDLIARIRKNPLLRAFRVDKLTYAALEATLFEYLVGSKEALPLMRMLSTTAEEIEQRCCAIVQAISSTGASVTIVPVESVVGGGTAPTARLKSHAISVRQGQLGADELLKKLRECEPPVIGRIVEDAVVLDLRTVPPQMDEIIRHLLEQL